MDMDTLAVKRQLLKGLKGHLSKGMAEDMKCKYCGNETGGDEPDVEVKVEAPEDEAVAPVAPEPSLDEDPAALALLLEEDEDAASVS